MTWVCLGNCEKVLVFSQNVCYFEVLSFVIFKKISCFYGHCAQPEQKPANNIDRAAERMLSFEGTPVLTGTGKQFQAWWMQESNWNGLTRPLWLEALAALRYSHLICHFLKPGDLGDISVSKVLNYAQGSGLLDEWAKGLHKQSITVEVHGPLGALPSILYSVLFVAVTVWHKLLFCFIFNFFPSGDAEQVDKFNRRLVKVTKHHADECKQLLSLMGIPYIEVSSELKIVVTQSMASNRKGATC